MAQFKALSPDVQVNGQTVLSVVDGMGSFKKYGIEVLQQCGINEVASNQWYSQQAWLDAFRAISTKLGPATLKQIGVSIPKNAQFPPGINTLEQAMASIDVAYHMNRRGGEIGHYAFKASGERAGQIVCNNPYPCEFDQGIVEAMAKRFKPPGCVLVVSHDDTRPCRKKGADTCTYNLRW